MKTALIVAALSLGACAHVSGDVMDEREIAANGERDFKAPYNKVFGAVVEALKAEGYDVVVANREKGVIRTNRRDVRTVAHGSRYVAMAITYSRQYVVNIGAVADNAVRVRATPHIFANNEEMGGSVWVLEGPHGERALWDRLFATAKESL